MSFSEWKTYTIEELGKIVTGKTPPTKDTDNFGNEYPFITPVDMNGQKHIYSTARNLSELGKEKVKNFLLPKNTICVSCIGSDMGKVVKTTKPSLTNQQINSIICYDNFDSDFIYYAMKLLSPTLRSIGHQSTAVPIINKTDFSNFEIDAPENKETQTRIASILSSLDDAIELNRQTNQTLEEMAKTIFKEWFVNFNFPNSTGEMQASELGDIPVGWRVGNLENIIELNPKLKINKGTISKYIEMKDLSENISSINSYREREFSAGSKFQNGDILLARITPCLENGKTGLVSFLKTNEIGWGSTEFIVLRGKSPVGSGFAYCLSRFEEFRNYAIKSMIGSSGRQRVVESILVDYNLPIAPIDIYKKFEETVESLFFKIQYNEKENQTLSDLRDTLLLKLMKGEIEVNG